MQHRAPSLGVPNRAISNIRRRSGGPPKPDEEESLRSYDDATHSEGDDAISEHTILLVDRMHRAAPSALLPFAPEFEDRQVDRQIWDGNPVAPLSPIPLTPPRPETLRVQTNLSPQSAHTAISSIPRLPTPDFANPKPKTLRALLPRGLSFISFHIPATSFLSSTPASSRPQSVRTDSGGSVCESTWSSDTAASVDSGHKSLIPSIGTTDRFTHKWPKPHSLRRVDIHSRDLDKITGPDLTQALEEGQGLRAGDREEWTVFRWCLLFSVSTVFVYGTTGLICAIMTWFRTWDKADVMNVADNDVLILITLSASAMVFTSLVGFSGVFLNSRPILATYTILLWPPLLALLAVGYISYRRATFSLDHKLNFSWSQFYTPLGRLLIQNSLRCCGYYSPLHDATPSKNCYSRSPLPGCKGKLFRFERDTLGMVWAAAFSIALLHLVNVLIALLCANHLTRTFGKGVTPKKYRLTATDVRADADKILRGMNRTGDPAGRPNLSRGPSSGWFRKDQEEEKLPLLHGGDRAS